METNKVILDIETYNELRDFKKAISEKQVVCTYSFGDEAVYMTTEECVHEIAETNNNLLIRLNKLRVELEKCKDDVHIEVIEKIKKMTILEFIKWRYEKTN